jgi:hypothetical protein
MKISGTFSCNYKIFHRLSLGWERKFRVMKIKDYIDLNFKSKIFLKY